MSAAEIFAAPGSVLEIRDETWLVTRTERASDGWFVEVQGLSELVRGTQAIFSTAIDLIVPLDPEQATVKVDSSPGFQHSRLWLEATLRKTAVPLTDRRLTVATKGLADPLPYQLTAVRKALDPANLRPRILLADAVGLGKTIEIGMILSELVRRGRGERILVVTPRHVLEQMQFELWTRFALPFVRLDSVGIQRIRQKLPGKPQPVRLLQAGDRLDRHPQERPLPRAPGEAALGRRGDRRVAQRHQRLDAEQPSGPTAQQPHRGARSWPAPPRTTARRSPSPS